MTIYRSKIGAELVIPLLIILGGLATLFIINGIWAGLIIMLATGAFIVHILITTRYMIINGSLQIVCGFLYNKTFAIDTIRSINETNNVISSPAASLDRLEIRLNKIDSVIVSPKDKIGFVRHLKKINPEIHILSKGLI